MEIFLFLTMLIGFAVMYLVLKITLFWSIILLLFIVLAYVALRYPRGREDYGGGFSECLYMILMVIMIVLIFVLVGPQPIPIAGDRLTYGDPWIPGDQSMLSRAYTGWCWSVQVTPSVLLVALVVTTLLFLAILSVALPTLQIYLQAEQQAGGSKGGGEKEGEDKGKPRVGVGT